MKQTIYEITNEYMELIDLLESGEYDEDMVRDSMESIEFDFEEKAEGYAKIIRNYESEAAALKAEEQRIHTRRTVAENAVKRLKSNLQYAMNATGKTKFKKGTFSFSIAKNGGALPVVLDTDPAHLPEDLVTLEIKPNTKAIAEALKNEPEKYEAFAHFGERGESLRIR